MATKSISRPAKSRRKTRPIQRNSPREPQKPQKPKVRPEPPKPTAWEQKVLDILWAEYRRADAAAKAAARFESEVHEHFVSSRIAEGYDEDEAGKIDRIFSADDFGVLFRKFLQIHVDVRLIKLLHLDDYEQKIIHERIREVFGPAVQAKPPMKKIQIGDAEIQQMQAMKAMASKQATASTRRRRK